MNKIKVIMEKEFDEILKNKSLLATMIFLPLLFVAICTGLIVSLAFISPSASDMNETQMYLSLMPPEFADKPFQEVMLRFAINAVLPFFMVIPAMVPIMISSYSIIGEKRNRTLEPLLASPVKVSDIIVGKALSALVPSILTTWVLAAVFMVIIDVVSYPVLNEILLPNTMWLIGIIILAPLLSLFGVLLTVLISSRVEDPRTAQQVSVVVVLPLVGLFIMQMAGLALMNLTILIGFVLAILVLDVLTVWFSSKMFGREEILTRWK